MSIGLHNIQPAKGSRTKKVRRGRGLGSGLGTTAGKGQKGQKSRSGASGFQRRGVRKLMLATPKRRGFTSPYKKAQVVNIAALSAFAKNEIVTPKSLKQKGLIRDLAKPVKILGKGDITTALTVQGCQVSTSAAEKILAAKGTIA